MKQFKFPLILVAVAVAICSAVAAALPEKKQAKLTVYHYTSDNNSLVEMKKIANWQGPQEEGCGDEGTVPCTFTYGDDFQAYLNSFSSASALINAADSRRTP